MTLRLTVAAAALMLSSAGFAAVTLTVPEEIKIVAVNDQEVTGGLFRSTEKYKLDAGENLLTVRYSEFFQHADNSHDILKSGVAAIRTPALIDGQEYRLGLVNAPKDFDAAQKYKDQPIFGLYDKSNQLLVQQAGAKKEQKTIFSNGVLGNAVDFTKKEVVPENQPAPIYAQSVAVKPTNVVSPVAAPKNVTINENGADQQLIQLWQKASKAERQKFMSWLAEQAN
ncbi:DUF2057 domain-containing protein [Acinetobacter sp. ANC 4945]|uniref:DUF2057 domain-containing protein n=1 Tax=Acinetobacter amyesii TaxID=2942470 RepID=A0A1T1H5G0_9GAMM|nr:DUF2057 domain-containing protein [Acinetobacter amyesii]MCL6248445.1 DUF2057 domain-containing protein [Acinetobacter amyesii]OOV85076.1 hypothetical protein B1202_00010 [Acinetobacter amyesii]